VDIYTSSLYNFSEECQLSDKFGNFIMNPFDFVKSINFKNTNLIEDNPEDEKHYEPFLANRSLSFFPDSILYANEMNCNHFLDKRLQYDYLFHSIKKGKRFSKWMKKVEDSEDILFLSKFYECSKTKAEEISKVLPDTKIRQMMKEYPEVLENT